MSLKIKRINLISTHSSFTGSRCSIIALLGISALIIIMVSQGYAQISFSYSTEVTETKNGELLDFPFAGAINSGQYGEMDLNGDNLADLVIFDRSSDKINTFISDGTQYTYDARYEYFFPDAIRNWIVFADYDRDGANDIFTHSNLGIKVYRNISTGGLPNWELITDPLLTLGTSTRINLFLNASDIPAINDLDGDGDLDILVYNFSSGAFIEHHKNFSVERTGNCGALDFERVSRTFGNVEECTCEEFAFGGQPCSGAGRIQHAGGKTILAMDRDGDGDKDIVIGQELCDDIFFLENKGSADITIFDEFTNVFPTNDGPLDFMTFPAPFYQDVDFDGLKDMVISPNLRANPGNIIDFQNSSLLYKNIGSESVPQFQFVSNAFLQNEMIDVGEMAFPAFADIDADGDQDLIIGNLGAHLGDTFAASLTAYENVNGNLNFLTNDLYGLASLEFTFIRPAFVDFDQDGRHDLIFTGLDGNNTYRYFYVPNSSNSGPMVFNLEQRTEIQFVLNPSDDPVLIDINGDNLLDILMARSNGTLQYHENTGSAASPSFQLVDDMYLGLEFSSANGNLSIAIDDINGNGSLDLLTTDRSGVLKIYNDFVNDQDQSPDQTNISIDLLTVDQAGVFGRQTKPAIVDFYGNGTKILALGSLQGGIRLLQSGSGSTGEDELSLTVFPNPTINKIARFLTPNSNMKLEVYTVSGKRVFGPISMIAGQSSSIDLSGIRNGLYIARIRRGDRTKAVRFFLDDRKVGL